MMDNPRPILLVEDNADDEALTLHALASSHLENTVVVTRDGAEALDYLLGQGSRDGRPAPTPPQVVLLDLHLPKIDGIEVLRRIRAEPRLRYLPVVVLTSSDEERDLTSCYELGANSFVRKPVEFTSFVEAVQQLGLYWAIVNRCPRGTQS